MKFAKLVFVLSYKKHKTHKNVEQNIENPSIAYVVSLAKMASVLAFSHSCSLSDDYEVLSMACNTNMLVLSCINKQTLYSLHTANYKSVTMEV